MSNQMKRRILLALGIVFVAFNLRPAITSVGPLIGWIRADLDISNGTAGFLTTLPLIAFALLSLAAPQLSRRWGSEPTIFAGLIILASGILVRSTGTIPGAFLGTSLVGVGIAIGNVLLPAIVKEKFSEKVGLMTSIYTTSMASFAAVGSGVSIPLAEKLHLGWKGSLAFWIVFAMAAIFIWLPQLKRHHKKSTVQPVAIATGQGSLWRSPLAWQVTFFMGLQSFLFYCTVAWLPAILQIQGINEALAGWLVSIMQFIGLPATFMTPVLANRLPHQKGIAMIIGIIQLAGILGLFVSNMFILIISIVLNGIAQGASISLALAFLGMRTTNAGEAARLSGMSQSVGYVLAAIGPLLLGFLFDWTQSWDSSLVVLSLVTILMTFAGIGAGRRGYVLSSTNERIWQPD
ncbi:MAG: MFS transporter [Thermoactinomyces sp.]